MMKKKKNNKGFSLVELIVVIAIMAVLVGVLAPQFIKYVESSRQSTDLQNIQQIKTAIEVNVASDDSVTANPTITITGGTTKTITFTTGGTTTTLNGIKDTTPLKSSGWNATAIVYTYSLTDGTWSTTAAAADLTNSKDPQSDIASIF